MKLSRTSDDSLVAVWCDTYQAFQQSSRSRDNDEDLLHQLSDEVYFLTFWSLCGLNSSQAEGRLELVSELLEVSEPQMKDEQTSRTSLSSLSVSSQK